VADMEARDLLDSVKQNLIIAFDDDDNLILSFIQSAIAYAEGYQHLDGDYYKTNPMSETTKQAIIMLSTHFYESRDGATAGFFADNTSGSSNVWNTIHNLLRLDRNWKV
jgi:uncharacterized phage protein (predicted DNA packaging)